ncbi:MAG TPA: H-NS histone family protein [Prosthecochloris aestuarii]|uniref:H-NS histone family protein n=1 Tax=Prosthecochloris aestuarii TaxID=1102 RepID=A0A831WPJ7_PROAE|nr:H-NS histone family protein [Prosthecochloris aestuarii]
MELFPDERQKEVKMSEHLTLKEIQEKIKQLHQKEAEIIAREKAAVIEDLKEKVRELDIQPDEIFGKSGTSSGGARKPKMIRYKRSEDEVWAGRGKKPEWCADMSKEELEKYKLETPIPLR